jgi:hypothetical protein
MTREPIRLRLAPKPRNRGRKRKVELDPEVRREDPAASFSSWVSANCPRQALDDMAPPQQLVEHLPAHAGHYVPPPIADDVELPDA